MGDSIDKNKSLKTDVKENYKKALPDALEIIKI